ncbi:MAG TPA: hypothetical protein VEH48_00595 [Candidatus Nitrosopolaris sp.]|nr:hypothetical protein [Candidatus Nitrosopolaris sp.]
MPSAKKYKSRRAAIETLRRFFAGKPDTDRLSVEEVFIATGRQKTAPRANMAWLSNKLTTLRYHNLIDSEYSYEGRRRLEAISLTLDGKRALGQIGGLAGTDSGPSAAASPPLAGLSDALAIVSALQQQYPRFDIALTIKPKDSPQ